MISQSSSPAKAAAASAPFRRRPMEGQQGQSIRPPLLTPLEAACRIFLGHWRNNSGSSSSRPQTSHLTLSSLTTSTRFLPGTRAPAAAPYIVVGLILLDDKVRNRLIGSAVQPLSSGTQRI